ncbi:Endocytosis regulator [Purpureocillium takamizusanense]|uniref:Endocytosis regulator n=1 Tax=Purpureocillium takamizusanense TaxID=2060973 RepID=A0A9Q8QN07_9HYPO|nr:Endocytosis regulator [Purpureocillium takamizusanense]UNI22151.1 Endocytosis regulator [Purpureocillium takamizusanense]
MENPIVVFDDSATDDDADADGALLHGKLELIVDEDSIDLVTVHGVLDQHILYKKPAHSSCDDCLHKHKTLAQWPFANRLQRLRRGVYTYPFACRLDMRLPASLDTPIYAISYHLKAEAKFAKAGHASIASVAAERPVKIGRATVRLPPPLPLRSVTEHRSGPIEIALRYSRIVDPTAPNKVALQIFRSDDCTGLWTLVRVTWKLTEKVRVVPSACERHKTSASEGPPRMSAQVLGKGVLSGEWPCYDHDRGGEGLQFEYSLDGDEPPPHDGRHSTFTCSGDVDYGSNASVTHSLAVSMMFHRESHSDRKGSRADDPESRIVQVQCDVRLARYFSRREREDADAAPAYLDLAPGPPDYSC